MQLRCLCVGGVPQFGCLQPNEQGGEREAGQTAVSWTASELASCAEYAPFSLQAVCGEGDSWTVNLRREAIAPLGSPLLALHRMHRSKGLYAPVHPIHLPTGSIQGPCKLLRDARPLLAKVHRRARSAIQRAHLACTSLCAGQSSLSCLGSRSASVGTPTRPMSRPGRPALVIRLEAFWQFFRSFRIVSACEVRAFQKAVGVKLPTI